MNCEERKQLINIINDCKKLKKAGQLTEYGEGEMNLAKRLLKRKP